MVKIRTIFRWWLILVILYATGILGSFNMNITLLSYFMDISPILMYAIIRFTPRLFKHIIRYAKRLDKFLFLYLGFWCAEIVYTLVVYNGQFSINPILLIRKNLYWLNILMVYPVLYIFEQDGGMKRFLNNILVISVMGNLQRFIAWLAYSRGTVIFPSIIKDGLSIRNGVFYRLGGCSLHYLGYDLSICNYAKEKKYKNLYLILTILFFLYQVIIGQSRAGIICYIVIACYAAYYLLTQKYEKYRRQYKIAIIVIIALSAAYLLFAGYLHSFVGSFSSMADSFTAGSTTNRLYAIDYYWSLMKEKPLFGIGFIYDDSDVIGAMARYLRGYGTGVAYLEDLGFMGQFFQVGILGSLVLFFIIKRMYSNARSVGKHNQFDGTVLTLLFIHVLLMGITTFSLFLKSLFYLVPLYLAISEFLYDKDVRKNEIYNYNNGI